VTSSIRTLCDIFYHSVETFRKPDHLLHKKDGVWEPISSDAFLTAVEELSMGLRSLGIEEGDRVAILSENRPEWAYADLATLCAGAVDAPIYSTLTAPQVLYILNDAGAKAVFVSNAAQLHKVQEVRAQAPLLRHVIRMDDGHTSGTLSLEEVRVRGREGLATDRGAVKKRAESVEPEDLATLIYTSGTTGDPKGVMLTHANLVSNVQASTHLFAGLGTKDVALSFLPLCHVFERMGGHYVMLRHGVTIAYAEGVDHVSANLTEVKPTLLLSVPRLYEKMYARVNEKVAHESAPKQAIFRWAMRVGAQGFAHQVARTRPGAGLKVRLAVANKLVFGKIKQRVGGRIRLFVSGGAPLSREIALFFGAAGLPILEGYGLTETSPVIAVNLPDRMKPGTVGPLLDGVEAKIAADGEILVRGPNVMKGYYKNPEATAEAIDKDGFFHTGDIGLVDAEGFLVITDRKKDILVTSGGKNIAPQPIENRLKSDKYFAEVVMVGNKRNFPAALVVPNFEMLEKWSREKGLKFKDREDLVARPEIVAFYKARVDEVLPDLASFERIKKLCLLPRELSLEAGELTPTLKVKRRVIEARYKELIDRMYEGAA
jgi:long-chain acyl-CoA synthetase